MPEIPITDDEVNAVALAYWGPSVTYDREKLRAALMTRQREAGLRAALTLDVNFPCDGGCNTNDGPAEDCSLHGRSPRDLWDRLEIATRRLNAIRRYAEERRAYGTRGRTVHSSRIASDLLQILEPDAPPAPDVDADGDYVSSGQHRQVTHQGSVVCDTCINVLGINVRWDHAILRPEHNEAVSDAS